MSRAKGMTCFRNGTELDMAGPNHPANGSQGVRRIGRQIHANGGPEDVMNMESHGDHTRPEQDPPYAARLRFNRPHTVFRESTRCSIISLVWSGVGVKRRRSVPRGTVG